MEINYSRKSRLSIGLQGKEHHLPYLSDAIRREYKKSRINWYGYMDGAEIRIDHSTAPLEIIVELAQGKRNEEECCRMMRLEALLILGKEFVHDFNDLMTVGMGYLSLARLYTKPDHPTAPFLEKAEENLTKFSKLTDRLKELTGERTPFLRKVAMDSLFLDSIRWFLDDFELKRTFVKTNPL